MFGLFIWGVTTGQPENLLHGYDINNPRQQCGVGNLKDYPYVYFASPYPSLLNRTVCVKACPTSYSMYVNGTVNNNVPAMECMTNNVISSCASSIGSFNYITAMKWATSSDPA
jgi:hypothetical protein